MKYLPALQAAGRLLGVAAILVSHSARAAGEPVKEPIFISGQGEYHTYRIPSLLVSKRGALLAFCEGRKSGSGDAGNIDLLLRRSLDQGRTWEPVQTVWDDGPNTCGNPCPVLDRDTGTIWLLLTWNRGDDREPQIIAQTSKDTRRVFVTCSTNEGATWAAPREITREVKRDQWTWYATGPGAGIQIENGAHRGRLVIPCDHIEAGSKRYYSHVIYSDDRGQSWKLGGSTPGDQVNECEVAELAGGRLLLNMRNYDRAQRTRQSAVSADGGLTWTDQRHVPELVEPICQASLRRHSWPSGARPGVLLFSNPASSKRERLTLRASFDDGATWPAARLLEAGPSAYSCLAVLPNGEVGALYETGQANPYERLVFARLSVEWIRAGGDGASGPPRGYGIPLVDLAGETNRQVVVDREPGQYLGHPTTVLLEDGKTLLCVYPKGHGRGPIVLKRSTDGGLTWSERLPVPENWATSLETPTLHRTIDASGKKRLIVWSGLHPARLAVSEDDGLVWSPLRAAGEWGGIVVMGFVEPLRTGPGHYLAMFHDDGRFFRSKPAVQKPAAMTLYKTFSRDGGLGWSEPEAVFQSAEIHLCEPGAIRSPDGRELAVLLRENKRVKNSHAIFSTDEGKTWTAPRPLPGALTGDRHTGKYAPDGRLFISFRDTTLDSPTQGDWVAWVGTYEDIAQGREGQYRVRLMDNQDKWDCAYPGVEILPDGTFVATTYGHWTQGQPPYIVSVRLKLAELDRKARAAGHAAAANTALIPVPGIERDFYDWWERHEAVKKTLRAGPVDLVFVGDSITHLWGGAPQPNRSAGAAVWEHYYSRRNAVNLGFGWDRTQQALWRLDHGEFDGVKPKAAVVLIGTNNLKPHNARENSNEEIVAGIRAVCDRIRTKSPTTRILLLGLFPRGQDPADPDRARIRAINEELRKWDGRDGIAFLDAGPSLLGADGRFLPGAAPDFLHPSQAGYRLWAETMEPVLARLLGDAPVGPMLSW